MTKEEAKKIKNLIKNVDATENSYSFACKMIDDLVTKEQPYWQTDTPTEDGMYIIVELGLMDDIPFYTLCFWSNIGEVFYDSKDIKHRVEDIYAWHRIKPYEIKSELD